MATDFSALAKRLIDKNGRPITIVNLGETPADPTKPWRGAADARAEATEVPGTGAFVTGAPGELGITFENGAPDSQVVLFPAADDDGETLEDFDEIVDGSTRWRIVETKILQPGTTRFIYAFLVEQ